jgi:hypothetical protein
MDQNYSGQTAAHSQSQEPPVFPSPHSPEPKLPPKPGRRQIVFAVFISILALLALGLALSGLLAASKKSDKNEQAAQAYSMDKRLAVLEAASSYTEKQVDKDRGQAVFLSSGQVYFGKITKITTDTIKLVDIYYLKSGTVNKEGNPPAGTDVSLVKLGAELHAPDDVMFIERKNLSFWENLQADGQVSRAITSDKKSHP